MNNCQAGAHVPPPANDVAPDETRSPFSDALPDRQRWPETRRALVLWTQEYLDRELARLPRRDWFTEAVAAVLNSEHAQQVQQ